MKFKRVMAFLLSATMILGTGVTAFATTDELNTGYNATGTGIIEYDNSGDIGYDRVKVPTSDEMKKVYDFIIDPMMTLNSADSDMYDANTVFFVPEAAALKIDVAKTIAKIKDADTLSTYADGGNLAVYEKTALTENELKDADTLAAFTVDSDTVKLVTPATKVFYVYIPDTAEGKEGLGKYEELTDSNLDKYLTFTIDAGAVKEVSIRKGYKFAKEGNGITNIAEGVCDGNLYVEKLTPIDETELDASEYCTITDGTITETKLYAQLVKEGETEPTSSAVAAANIVSAEEDVKYTNQSQKVVVENQSTKDKVISANVTLKNITGITMSSSETVSGKTAGMYMLATNGTDKTFLAASEDGSTATAKFTMNLAAPDLTDNIITYRTNEKNDNTGGHNWLKYEGPSVEYNSAEFFLEAGTNSGKDDADVKAAWTEFANTVTATTRPEVNVIYKINDVDYEPTLTGEEDSTIAEAGKTTTLTGADASKDYTITADFGGGKFATTKVSSVTSPLSAKASSFVTPDVEHGTITIAKSLVSAVLTADETKKPITIVLSNADGSVTYEYTIILAVSQTNP